MTDQNTKNTITFNEYENFIYLNTHLSRTDARSIARDCWNKGMDKYEALEKIEIHIKEA